MRPTDVFALFTLLYAAGVTAWIGVSAWILAVWALSALTLGVLYVLGRVLAREFGIKPRRGRRLPWIAGGVAAFLSCTMAAGLVRAQAPLFTFGLLGALMVMGVASLRFAYHRPRSPGGNAK